MPKIYVASLSDYNNGVLHGRWIDCTFGAEHIHEEIAAMLAESKQSNAEEWAIHDYEGFAGVHIDETEDIDKLAELAELLEEHGPAFAVYMEHVGAHWATSNGFQDAYCGQFKDEEDYAYDFVAQYYELAELLASYFDYEKFARDLFIDDVYGGTDEDGNFHVFRHC